MYYLQIGTIRRRVSSLFSEWYTCHSSLLWARRLFWSIRSTNSEQYCGIVRCCCHTISTAWSYNEQNSVSPRGGAGSEQRQSHWRWINTKLYYKVLYKLLVVVMSRYPPLLWSLHIVCIRKIINYLLLFYWTFKTFKTDRIGGGS